MILAAGTQQGDWTRWYSDSVPLTHSRYVGYLQERTEGGNADSRSWEQQDLAGTLGISQSRVSQIERQGVDDTVVSTLATYVEALGASVLIVADFGEEQFVLRRTSNPSISGETGMSRPDL